MAKPQKPEVESEVSKMHSLVGSSLSPTALSQLKVDQKFPKLVVAEDEHTTHSVSPQAGSEKKKQKRVQDVGRAHGFNRTSKIDGRFGKRSDKTTKLQIKVNPKLREDFMIQVMENGYQDSAAFLEEMLDDWFKKMGKTRD